MRYNEDLIKKFNDSISHNTKLSNYSWFNLGGNAKYFYKAKDKNQLKEFLLELSKKRETFPDLEQFRQAIIEKNKVINRWIFKICRKKSRLGSLRVTSWG